MILHVVGKYTKNAVILASFYGGTFCYNLLDLSYYFIYYMCR